MREELKRYNNIGNLAGIRYFSQVVLADDKVQRDSVHKLCALQNNIRLNVGAAIMYFEYMGLINESGIYLDATEKGKSLLHAEEFEYEFCKICIEQIIKDRQLDLEAIHYSRISNSYYIEKFGFTVSAALFRNILIQYKALYEKSGVLNIEGKFEPLFALLQKNNKTARSLDKLKEQLEKQELQGEKAELFVLEYEKQRLFNTEHADRIKRISVIDVAAGYDIVSFESEKSLEYDRFIEVKSFVGTIHFYWSSNEIDKAKLYGDKYCIYLVDATRISEDGYKPEIIVNPAITILESEKWLMSPTSYMVIPT